MSEGAELRAGAPGRPSLKERLAEEGRRFLVMFLYDAGDAASRP